MPFRADKRLRFDRRRKARRLTFLTPAVLPARVGRRQGAETRRAHAAVAPEVAEVGEFVQELGRGREGDRGCPRLARGAESSSRMAVMASSTSLSACLSSHPRRLAHWMQRQCSPGSGSGARGSGSRSDKASDCGRRRGRGSRPSAAVGPVAEDAGGLSSRGGPRCRQERSRWVRACRPGVTVAVGVVRAGGRPLRRYQRRQGSESADSSSSRGTAWPISSGASASCSSASASSMQSSSADRTDLDGVERVREEPVTALAAGGTARALGRDQLAAGAGLEAVARGDTRTQSPGALRSMWKTKSRLLSTGR